MAKPKTSKLQDLVRRVARQEATLAKLRSRLDSHLARLHRRRETLRAELDNLEAGLATASRVGSQNQETAEPPDQEPQRRRRRRRGRSGLSLAGFLANIVREANGKPVPISTLKEETVRRRFPTSSRNVARMVEKRASEMVQNGLLHRDPATGGYLLSETAEGQEQARPRRRRARGGRRKGQQPLRVVLLDLMKRAGRTMSVQELADQARAAGYRTDSAKFKNVIWVALRNMSEVEHDPAGGYRLKKGRG